MVELQVASDSPSHQHARDQRRRRLIAALARMHFPGNELAAKQIEDRVQVT